MARLPKTGQDSGSWGDILNDYLTQAHKADGTLKDSSVTTTTLAAGSIRASHFSTSAGPTASQSLVFDGTGLTWLSPGSIVGSDRWLALHAGGDLEALIVGAITRNASGAATSAGVVWPDGTSGTYTATTVSSAFPGAIDAYTVTYAGNPIKIVTQPAVTRDSSTGAVINRPAMIVS